MNIVPPVNCYHLNFRRLPRDPRDARFVERWASTLVSEFTHFSDEPFILRIGEFHLESQRYGWIAEVRSVQTEAGGETLDLTQNLAELIGFQYYFGHNRDNREEDYAGRINISVIMPEQPYSPGMPHRPLPEALLLLRLAYMHYYDQIHAEYAEWSTDYHDTPVISDRFLSSGDADRDPWLGSPLAVSPG